MKPIPYSPSFWLWGSAIWLHFFKSVCSQLNQRYVMRLCSDQNIQVRECSDSSGGTYLVPAFCEPITKNDNSNPSSLLYFLVVECIDGKDGVDECCWYALTLLLLLLLFGWGLFFDCCLCCCLSEDDEFPGRCCWDDDDAVFLNDASMDANSLML